MITRIIDTNVLLDRPLREIILSYPTPCKIIIPFPVIQELDTFKNSKNEFLRRNARAASAYIDELRLLGPLYNGVELSSGHIFKIEMHTPDIDLSPDLDSSKTDTKILKMVKHLQQISYEDVILCTQDINERICADLLNIKAEAYGPNFDLDSLYKGWRQVLVSAEDLSVFASEKMLGTNLDMAPNEFAILTNEINFKHTMLARFDGNKFIPVRYHDCCVYGVKAVNVQQKFFLDLLLDPEVELITALGRAGGGKTLLSLAAGIEQTEVIGSSPNYSKLFVTRSPEPVGKDIGFLPGDEQQKISPWLGAIFDNLEFLTANHATTKSGDRTDPSKAMADLLSLQKIELRAFTFIRGRSLPRQFMLIDEAQNLTQHEIKTIISRAGIDTKVILTGDIEQIDNPRLTASNNGLVATINAFKGQPNFGHIILDKTERSRLAELATLLL